MLKTILMINLIIIITAIIVLVIASIQDMKKREVMDWLNYGLIFFALTLRSSFSLITFNNIYILQGIYGFVLGLIIAYVMFYTGQWGGGDSKLLMGLGALLGFNLSLASTFVVFIVNSFIAGAFYGLIFSIVLVIINRKKFTKAFNKNFLKTRQAHNIILLISAIMAILSFLIANFMLRYTMLLFAVVIFLWYYLFLFTKSAEESCMLKYYEPNKLTEGDWIAKDVYYKGRYIAGPKDLGIEKPQIKKIQKLYKQNKIKKVLVKEGIPFVPSFLIAYILTLFLGNWLLMFL